MGMALLIAVMGWFFTPKDRKRPFAADGVTKPDKRVDWVGGLLLTAAVCLFTFSLSASGSAPDGWRTPCKCEPLPESSASLEAWIDTLPNRKRLFLLRDAAKDTTRSHYPYTDPLPGAQRAES
jgi:hypothetical protein